MAYLQKLMKSVLSDSLISKISGIFYGWHGDYKSWEIAKSRCKGYQENQILDRVLESALKVKNGEIPYERDSIAFDRKVYSFPVLSAILWIVTQKNNKLNILDFGGSLGTSYYQNLSFLGSLSDFNWCIVEQPHFVAEGNRLFADENLHFFNSISDCTLKYNIDAVLLSSVLPYVEKPYDLLEEIISKKIEFVIVDRTLFVQQDNDRLTIQRVPKKIYNASYCCWFLSESKFLSTLLSSYDLIYDFDINQTVNLKSLFKGYLFRLKKNTL